MKTSQETLVGTLILVGIVIYLIVGAIIAYFYENKVKRLYFAKHDIYPGEFDSLITLIAMTGGWLYLAPYEWWITRFKAWQ
jgi:hypothetical protein